MNDTTELTSEVAAFVAAVRARFVDLDDDEREELLGGLEADLSDQVAERGPDALSDPDAYAAELRTAAGLPPAGRRNHGLRASAIANSDAALDKLRADWERRAASLPGDVWGLVQSIQPFWWLLRAWVAVQLIDLGWGNGGYSNGLDTIPSLRGLGLPLLVGAAVISVQIGRGKLWPGREPRSGAPRQLLLALNVFAMVLVPVTVSNLVTTAKVDQWYSYGDTAVDLGGLSFNGEQVHNIYPYDATGQPLVGVQLVDDNGRPLDVVDRGYEWGGMRTSPWFNGRTKAWNVFPQSESKTRSSNGRRVGEPAQQPAPYDVLPPVTLTGVTPTRTETEAAQDEAEKKAAAKKTVEKKAAAKKQAERRQRSRR